MSYKLRFQEAAWAEWQKLAASVRDAKFGAGVLGYQPRLTTAAAPLPIPAKTACAPSHRHSLPSHHFCQ